MKRVLISIILITLSIVVNMPIFTVSNVHEAHNIGALASNFANISFTYT